MQSRRRPAVGHNQEAAFSTSCSNTRRPAARTPKAASCSADGREFCWPPRRACMAKKTLAHTHAHAQTYVHTYACARFYTLVYAAVYANICVHIRVYVYRCAKAVVRCAKRLSAARPPWRESGCPLPSKAVVRKAVVRCPLSESGCPLPSKAVVRKAVVRCPLSESGCPLLTLNVASRCWRKCCCLNCVW